jgi:hydroxyacylglutathione hydrolase
LKPVNIEITPIISFSFEENSYIVRYPSRKECLVVDPGLEAEKIVDYLEKEGIEPASILVTHGHCDHIAGNIALKRCWPACPIVVGKNEAPKLTDPILNLSAMFGLPTVTPPGDILVEDGDIYEAAGFRLEILEIPGHSAGHIVFKIEDCDPPVVFVGDVIFSGSVGRFDFPDGDFKQLVRGIREKLFTLPEETVLFPGHGPSTTVGTEKRSNPVVGGKG